MLLDMDPTLVVKKALLNLLPFVGTVSKRIGRKVHIAPILLKKSRSYVLMIN